MNAPILTYDSGLGGLSVLKPVLAAFPSAPHIYVADDEVFPIGLWEEEHLVTHCLGVIGGLIEKYEPRLVIIACNTASTVVLEPLRARFDVPFVGTVPAIKPAAEQTKSGLISILATPGTIRRDYTRSLMDAHASGCTVELVGAPNLASLAEDYLKTGFANESAVWNEISSCFVEAQGKKTDVVVLGCTHYPLLLPILEKLAPWPVSFLDPGPAIARRVVSLLGECAPGDEVQEVRFLTTSGVLLAQDAVALTLRNKVNLNPPY